MGDWIPFDENSAKEQDWIEAKAQYKAAKARIAELEALLREAASHLDAANRSKECVNCENLIARIDTALSGNALPE